MSTIGVKKIQYPDGSDILTLDSSGSLAIGGTVTLGDDQKIKLGASGDLEIFHDTTNGNSVIHDTGAGNLRIRADDFQVTNAAASANLIFANDATGEVKLYHNGNEKLATASTGVAITGGVAIGGTGSANLLDDFEEGTYTHGLSNFSTAISSGWTTGRYVKIGHTVWVHGVIVANSGNVGGTVAITGLPFTVIAGSQGYSVGMINGNIATTTFGSGNINPIQRIDPNQTYIQTGITSGTGGVNLVYSGFYTSA